MVQDANTALADDGEHFAYAVADVQCLPFDDGSFDAVVANHMLYCAQDRHAAIAEIRRVLRRSGHLYASTNGKAHMRELDDLVRRFDPQYRLDSGSAVFGLENGREQLLEHFAAVDLHRYDDALVVTDAMALVEWAQSWAPGTFPVETLPDFYAHMEREGGKGAIRVGKDSGLFVATSQD
jgi:SAM-dependent methyltransferase